MVKTIGLFLLLISGNVFGQRLYLHDIPNGNYESYEVGAPIVLYMLNSDIKIQGIITKLDKDMIHLKDGTHIPLDQITTILPPNKLKPIIRFVSVVGGTLLIFTGTVFFISGVEVLVEEPGVGAGVMLVGAGIVTGGVYILYKSKAAKKQVKQAIIDNINYRVFIE